MSFSPYIGMRYLRARKSSAFLSTISIISVIGVAVGVCALVVVLAVIRGYEEDLRDKLIGSAAHGNLMKVTYGFTEYRETLDTMRKTPGVVAATPFVLREVMISSERNISGVLFKGVDLDTAASVTALPYRYEQGSLDYMRDPKRLLEDTKKRIADDIAAGKMEREFFTRTKRRWGEAELPPVAIGQELATFLNVGVGDEVNIVNPLGGGMGPTGPVPQNQYFRVAGIFHVGMFEYDMKFVYTPLSALQQFAEMGDDVTAIEFRVAPEDIYDTPFIGEAVVEALGGFPYKARDWMEMNRNLFSALRLQRAAMFVILTFITLVAAFGIASTLFMMVIEKEKEIAILKSMGASRRSIMAIFVLDGLTIGGIGTAIGLAAGVLLCALIPYLPFELDAEIYYMSGLSAKFDPLQIGATIVTAIAISFIATLYPSWRASRLNPVEGLREE
ncbi:MAG: ABC transporter permease [Myxococcales bacterium]|nr:MAG: ABC transporter permease [Myxococcales bacterium]